MQEFEWNKILEQYEIVVSSTRKIRGAILCDTDRGVLLLREAEVSEKRIPALIELYEHLEKSRCVRVDMPVKNRDGMYATKGENGNNYILKRMPPGRECDVRRMAELIKATENLAKMHLTMRKKLTEKVSNAENLEEEYMRHNRELRKVREYIRKSSLKGEFEYLFLEYFDQVEVWADVALQNLKTSDYRQLYQKSIEAGHMVHGEYNYHNILCETENSKEKKSHGNIGVYTINFDRFKKNIQIEDLYYFLRKVMEKLGYKEWIADGILNTYSSVLPLGQSEMDYLKNRLVYPEKFFKLANSYYHSNKAWISSKSIEKMQMSVRKMNEKEQFLNHFFHVHI